MAPPETPSVDSHLSSPQILNSQAKHNHIMPSSNSIDLQALTSLYQRAKDDFLLRKYDSARSLCSAAISKLTNLSPVSSSPSAKIIQTKIWILYINLIAAVFAEKSIITKDLEIKRLLERSPEKVVNDVWLKVINEGYDEETGEVPGEVVVACILFCLNQQQALNGRNIIEEWLNALPDELILHLERISSKGATEDPILKSYEKVVELYVLQVLPKLRDWDLASKFLVDNEVINKERKKVYEHTLLKLKEKSNKPTPPKHTKSKKDKVKKEEANGHHVNGFFTTRTTENIHTSGLGIFANNNQKYVNNGSSSFSSNMIRNNKQFIRSLHPGTRTTAITTNSRNIIDNRQIPSPTSSAVNRIVSTSSTTTFNRVVEYFMLSNIKEKLRDVFYKWLARSWQTLKAGTTLTYI
ncbi:microbody (Peroxisome) proliferation protein peroxin 26 [Rhizophagus clarus]|uniref:Microbody (Peroxisome) proliferation protein peroxin 26 n=1 Tax=Rhizophagus clarus TaxID=94130 RepID=A0A8H3MIF7_9GLOM|nr:microbody (Peroxisome) proliferation protein peroxin 26 [Rhizophagus clarus]